MSVLSTSRQPTKGQLLASFTNGVRPDQELYKQEIAVQKAWAQGLTQIGLLTTPELNQIDRSLTNAEILISKNEFEWREEDEDIHMNLERFVNEETNGLGKKMHAGRSRNDLIATTLKLHVTDSVEEITTLLKTLIGAMINLAETNKDVIIPGMTHLQNGQPIRWSHAVLAHAWAFKRDLDKFQTVKTNALKCMPLGSAALSGTTLPIDLHKIAKNLGFNSPSHNSYDAVGDRDVVIDFVQAAAHFGMHLSRFSEDIIYWSSAPVGLIELSPDWSTGSSIMPNKRNPDVAELSRAKASLWIGDASGILTLMKGLATSYASDLHETKIPYLRVVTDIKLTLSVFTPFASELSVNREKAKALLNQGHILATEMANHMTDQGVPFREAYSIVAGLVELAESQKLQVHELSLNQIQALSSHITPQFMENLSFESTVEKRMYAGGSSLAQVNSQIETLKNFQ
jgi:argininosuccinate lyase